MLKYLLLFIFPVLVLAETYPVAEPDPIEEITRIAKQKETRIKEYIKTAGEKIWKYKAVYLPPASENTTRYIDPTYCLDRDIKIPVTDKNNRIKGWKILYPKGYCFNPLDYITVTPPPMVIFNACREQELKYVEKVIYPDYPDAIYIIAGCDLQNINKVAKKSFLQNLHWYFLTNYLKRRLNLRYTLSIVIVSHKKIKIREIKVSP